MTESGFREMGWEVAVLEEQYRDHVQGWDHFLPRLVDYAADGRGGDVTAAVDDELWSAVGDPTRRRMLDLLLVDGTGTATSLSEQLPVTRQAVAKHLAVLDRVGLVHGAAAGRERRYWVDDAQLARAAEQLAVVGSSWDGRLRRIARIAERIERQKQNQTTTRTPNSEQGAHHDRHPSPHRRRVAVHRRRLRRPHHHRRPVEAGGPPTPPAIPASAGRSRSASCRAGSTWR